MSFVLYSFFLLFFIFTFYEKGKVKRKTIKKTQHKTFEYITHHPAQTWRFMYPWRISCHFIHKFIPFIFSIKFKNSWLVSTFQPVSLTMNFPVLTISQNGQSLFLESSNFYNIFKACTSINYVQQATLILQN